MILLAPYVSCRVEWAMPGLTNLWINLWSCSMRLFRYLFCRSSTSADSSSLCLSSSILWDSSIFIDINHTRLWVWNAFNALRKKITRAHHAYEQLQGVSIWIYCPISIYPCLDLDISFVHSPRIIIGRRCGRHHHQFRLPLLLHPTEAVLQKTEAGGRWEIVSVCCRRPSRTPSSGGTIEANINPLLCALVLCFHSPKATAK